MQKVLHVSVQALWPKCNVMRGQQVSFREYARFADLKECLSLALMHNFRIQLCIIINVLLLKLRLFTRHTKTISTL